jgi:tetratricopeptide (TPR) repeat protein
VKTKSITVLSSAILFCLAFYIFKSSLGYDFVWDDREIIVNNEHIRSFSFNSILWAFTNTLGGHYQPLTWLSFIMNYRISGLESYGYRLTNILLHSINAALLMLVIYSILRLFNKLSSNNLNLIISSVVGASIFALHPLRVESVVWVTERRDVFSAFFLLISFLAYLHFRFHKEVVASNNTFKKKLYIISFCSFFMSLLCKAWAITFPAVLVLVDMAILNSTKPAAGLMINSIRSKIPFIVISFLFALVGVFAANTSGAMVSWEKLTLIDRILQASYGFNMYLLHTLYPSNLSPLYLLGKTNFHDIKFYAHFFVFISIFVSAYLIRNKYHWPLYFLLIYLVIILPVLGFSQSGPQIMADRYAYIALMPLYFVLSYITLKGLKLSFKQEKNKKIMLLFSILLVYVIILCALVNSTKRQILIWENEEALWSHAINIDSLNYRALSNRADYRIKKKWYSKAIEDYSLVLELDANNAYALNGRATARIYMGDLNGAIEDLNSALVKAPNNIDVLLNRGVAYNNLGNVDMARNDFQSIIKAYPDHEKVNYYLGISYFSSNEFNKAIKLFTKVNLANPEHIDAIYYRGLSYLNIENQPQAIKDFEYVLSKLHNEAILYKNAEQQLELLNVP